MVNSVLTLGLTSGGGGTANTYGVLNINGGTVLANSIVAGTNSGANAIAINNGTLVVTNTAGTDDVGHQQRCRSRTPRCNCLLPTGQANLTATNLTTGPEQQHHQHRLAAGHRQFSGAIPAHPICRHHRRRGIQFHPRHTAFGWGGV